MERTVLVTRPAAQAAGWVQRLRDAGLDARALPLIAIEPVGDTPALQAAWRDLPGLALAMFVSPNAVEGFFAARPAGARWPERLRGAAPGPGTVEALAAAGVPRECCVAPDAPPYDSAALWQRLQGEGWSGQRVLIVRGDGGRDEFAQALRAAGAQVAFVQAYQRSAPRWTAAQRSLAEAALASPPSHVWLLSSGEAVDHLQHLLPEARWQGATAFASHARIAERARAAGFGRVVEVAPTLGAIVAALREGGSVESPSS